MASDYFVMFVLSEGSGPAQGVMLGPDVSEMSSREHLEEGLSMDSGWHTAHGGRGQVLVARLRWECNCWFIGRSWERQS